MKIYPYSPASESAKLLADALGIKRLRHKGKALNLFKQTVINWGASKINREIRHAHILNPPGHVSIAANKLKTFNCLRGLVAIPPFTSSPEEVKQWLEEGKTVVVRKKLTGHSGEGIEIIKGDEEIPPAPLYTVYIPKKEEYRVHVFNGKAFFVQRKARKLDVPKEDVNWKIRNHHNGFIYAHKDVNIPIGAMDNCVTAVCALNLDFGAVDIVQGKDGGWYILEVNTACGLAGETLNKYVEQFRGN